MAEQNPHVIRARADKVHKLARLLESLRIDAKEANRMSAARWEAAARAAGVQAPSKKTKGLVVRVLTKELIDVVEFDGESAA